MAVAIKSGWCAVSYVRGLNDLYIMTVTATGDETNAPVGAKVIVPSGSVLLGRDLGAGVSDTRAVRIADIIGIVT